MFNPKEHLMDLKGKGYLQVMWRLVWFREEKPLWSIDTKLERLENDHAVFSAKIYDENGIQKSAGYGSESAEDFGDYIEKAETKAVGRALAMLGYGTQFAPELDEGERIVDTPVPIKASKSFESHPGNEPMFGKPMVKVLSCVDCGSVINASEKKYSCDNFGRPLCRSCQNKERERNK